MDTPPLTPEGSLDLRKMFPDVDWENPTTSDFNRVSRALQGKRSVSGDPLTMDVVVSEEGFELAAELAAMPREYQDALQPRVLRGEFKTLDEIREAARMLPVQKIMDR